MQELVLAHIDVELQNVTDFLFHLDFNIVFAVGVKFIEHFL